MKQQLVALSLLALACRAADADVRKLDTAFTAIDVAGTIAVEARLGHASVDVQGDADLVPLVSTTVRGGTLVIETPRDFVKRMRPNARIKVVVSTPELARVAISGTGTLDVDGLTGKSLTATIPGLGALRLAGKLDELRLDIAGTGEVKANKLVTDSVVLAIGGAAQASVYATRSFTADVTGTAMVRVHGKPTSVKKQVTGMAVIDVD